MATSGSTASSFPAPSSRARSTTSTLNLAAWSLQIHKDGLAGSTTIIVTAKHGQSPQDPNKLITVQDGPIISAINAAWAQTHPSNTSLIVAGTDDDLWQSYLSDNSQAACDFVKSYLWNHTAQGFDVNKNPVTVQHSGLAQIWAGADAANFFGVPVDNGHYPDVFGKVQEGIVYAKPTKLAEHGGMNTGDRHVLMVVSGPGIPVQVESTSVETTQVAPTILALLGLDPNALTAVQVEGTQVLPGLGRPHRRTLTGRRMHAANRQHQTGGRSEPPRPPCFRRSRKFADHLVPKSRQAVHRCSLIGQIRTTPARRSADMRSQHPRYGRQHQPKARASTRASRKLRRRRSSGCARCGLAR